MCDNLALLTLPANIKYHSSTPPPPLRWNIIFTLDIHRTWVEILERRWRGACFKRMTIQEHFNYLIAIFASVVWVYTQTHIHTFKYMCVVCVEKYTSPLLIRARTRTGTNTEVGNNQSIVHGGKEQQQQQQSEWWWVREREGRVQIWGPAFDALA